MKRKLILSLLAMLLPISAWCQSFSVVQGGVTFHFSVISGTNVQLYNNGSSAIQNFYAGEHAGVLTIPSSVNSGGTDYTVVQIGRGAIQDVNATTINFPSTLTTIESYAVRCQRLTSINIPASVTWIQSRAFTYTNSLNSITVDEANTKYDSRENCNAIIEKSTKRLILGCNYTTIPEGVVTIESMAFSACVNLTSINIPASVNSISEDTFSACTNLESITVADGNTKYDSRDNCNAIIEKSTNTLILGCMNSTIPETVLAIGPSAFSAQKLKSVNIPSSVSSIARNAFNRCSELTSLNIPAGVSSIDNTAFSGCTGLSTITVDNANTNYYSQNNAIITKSTNELILGCQTTTTVPDGVKSIGEQAFDQVYLPSIKIPSSVNTIKQFAFTNCGQLEEVTLSEGLVTIEGKAFHSCKFESLTLPSTVTTVGSEAFYHYGDFTLNTPYTLASLTSDVFGSSAASYGKIQLYVTPQKEYTTFACTKAIDFSGLSGVEAFVASGYDASTKKVHLTKVNVANANEGVILKATPGTQYILTEGTSESHESNLLIGVTTATQVNATDGENTNFVLSNGVFKKVAQGSTTEESTIANGKAYLQLPTSALPAGVRSIGISTKGDVTGIVNVELIGEEGNGETYDLSGRRVKNAASKGVYVKNGKKVIIK